jgi:hypothetical protein
MITKIVSGGQTGADQAALDVARELGIPHGGWLPKGRWTEVGPLPGRYQVQETPDADPAVRTEWNVRDSDATLIVSHGPLTGGSSLTRSHAIRFGKSFLHLDLNQLSFEEAADRLKAWLAAEHPQVLNVAGPRASGDSLIYDAVRRILLAALSGNR